AGGEGAPASGDLPSQAALVDQKQCEYWPPVLALRTGAEIEIRNSDPLLHNVHAKNSAQLFNFAMPVQGLKVRKQLPRAPMVIHVGCDVHPWMRAVIRTFDHPHFAISDESGRYRLPEIPSGKQQLVLWHQHFPEKTVQLEVQAGRPNSAN